VASYSILLTRSAANYRILYGIENDVLVVTVVRVGYRRDVYLG
jgi:mRNA-degrading endonuclease RelE of RelBE toxin-antitoxin system